MVSEEYQALTVEAKIIPWGRYRFHAVFLRTGPQYAHTLFSHVDEEAWLRASTPGGQPSISDGVSNQSKVEYQEPTGSLNDAQGHAGAELQIQVRISQDERFELLEAGVQVSGSLHWRW